VGKERDSEENKCEEIEKYTKKTRIKGGEKESERKKGEKREERTKIIGVDEKQ
jgi:hypothetical protein